MYIYLSFVYLLFWLYFLIFGFIYIYIIFIIYMFIYLYLFIRHIYISTTYMYIYSCIYIYTYVCVFSVFNYICLYLFQRSATRLDNQEVDATNPPLHFLPPKHPVFWVPKKTNDNGQLKRYDRFWVNCSVNPWMGTSIFSSEKLCS